MNNIKTYQKKDFEDVTTVTKYFIRKNDCE